MQLEIVKGDLFTADSDYALMHCVSADFALEDGIAKEFVKRDVKRELKHAYAPRWYGHGYALITPIDGFRVCINLVTKATYKDKPTYATVEEALMDARQIITSFPKIAMPKIGCGLGQLEWDKVLESINYVFRGTNLEIKIYDLDKQHN